LKFSSLDEKIQISGRKEKQGWSEIIWLDAVLINSCSMTC